MALDHVIGEWMPILTTYCNVASLRLTLKWAREEKQQMGIYRIGGRVGNARRS